MKTTKIEGVPLKVCNFEQKIAYELATRVESTTIAKEYNNYSREEKIQTIKKLCDMCMSFYRNNYGYVKGKFNEEAILLALKNGLPQYLTTPFIATTYTKVGHCFYLVKRRYLNVDLTKEQALQFRKFLIENEIERESSENGNLIHFEVYVSNDEEDLCNRFLKKF